MISRTMLPDRRAGMLLSAVATLLFLGVGGAVVLPSADPAAHAASPSKRDLDELGQRGMDVYRSEGCWYCHTQQVREVSTDAAFGEPLRAGDYPTGGPAMLGHERVGPDLTHVGSRRDAAALEQVLRDPRAGRRRSSMPSYAHLDGDDMSALVAYLAQLK